jgi:hypothetical protein
MFLKEFYDKRTGYSGMVEGHSCNARKGTLAGSAYFLPQGSATPEMG